MKYSYFCPGKAGKYLIRDMFWKNNKTHSLFCCGTPPIYAVMSTPAGDFDWYWEDDDTGNLVQTSYHVDGDIILDHTYNETWYPVPTNGHYSIKKLLKNSDIKASKICKGSFHRCFKHAFDTDIIVNPLVMLGYGGVLGNHRLGKLLRDHQPNLVNIPIDYVVDELNKRKNIVTHKEDIRELARNHFIGNGHIPYKNPDVYYTYTTEQYIHEVTKIINQNRQFEKDIISCLNYYNITYEIFNLDKDDYGQCFNLDQTFTKLQDPHPRLYDFIEPCDVIEGWIDEYVKNYP
tara:strand:+ start:236 stop:1105 length:870 start_codon:yes stop_codon:yes gene_type:complete